MALTDHVDRGPAPSACLGNHDPVYNANDALDASMWLNHPCPWIGVGIDLGRHVLLDTAQENHA